MNNSPQTKKSIESKQAEFKKSQIVVTPKAVKRLKAVMQADDKNEYYLRMSVEGGGCSGMTYNMDFEKTSKESEIFFSFFSPAALEIALILSTTCSFIALETKICPAGHCDSSLAAMLTPFPYTFCPSKITSSQ